MSDVRARWGRAGVRLTAAEQARRAGRIVRARAEADERHARALEDGRTKWAMGLVVPAHITVALDALDLYGPEVDAACLAREPEVDEWEAGRLYPKWEQVVALAELTGKQPDWFMAPVHTLSAFETSMRFHLPRGEKLSMPVHRFTRKALDAARRIGVTA
jgi:hypothetical protein